MSRIKQYWDDRAKQSGGSPAATTNDYYLRILESKTVIDQMRILPLQPNDAVLDIGCGDGRTLLELSKHFPKLGFYGIDYSSEMIATARRINGCDKNVGSRVEFSVGDATMLDEAVGKRRFALIISNRCLINLEGPDQQYDVLRQIANHLGSGGYYLGTENFDGGQNNLNRLRQIMNLDVIPVRWHNVYFDEEEFLSRSSGFFREVEIVNFSSTYYFVTRIVYSALCQREGTTLDYSHPIHAIAAELPMFGDFSPIKLIKAKI